MSRRRLSGGVLLVAAALLLPGIALAAYPKVQIKNNTEYTVSGTVKFMSAFCKNDRYSVPPGGTWRGKSRGVCLINGITGKISQPARHGESTGVVEYTSTGTSYSKFQINAHGGRYRVFSKQEFARVSDKKQGRSPGFYFVNKTDWPVLYSLEQAGCLYHDIVPMRWNGRDGVRKVDTGSVWFTLRVSVQPDGVNPQSDWDCVEPVAEIVGDVLFAAMSGGASGAAMAGAKFVAKTVTKQVIKAAAKKAAKKALKASVKSVRKSMKARVGQYLKETGTVTMGGQYAGYEWPFQCSKMPEYHITGGPEVIKDEDGAVYIRPGTPLKVTKVNGCGNDMMKASPLSKSAMAGTFPEDSEFDSDSDSGAVVSPSNNTPHTPPATGGKITLRSHHGKFVVAEGDGKANANRGAAREWEHFQLIEHGGDVVSFKGYHGKYLVAESDGRVNANRDRIGAWEKWRMIRNGNGTVSFKSHHGKYLVAEADGRLNANRDRIGNWEQFRMSGGGQRPAPPQRRGPAKSDWQCVRGVGTPVRMAGGHVQCAARDGRNCLWGQCTDAKVGQPLSLGGMKPLTCGPDHQSKYGGRGYDRGDHWCRKACDAFGCGRR